MLTVIKGPHRFRTTRLFKATQQIVGSVSTKSELFTVINIENLKPWNLMTHNIEDKILVQFKKYNDLNESCLKRKRMTKTDPS